MKIFLPGMKICGSGALEDKHPTFHPLLDRGCALLLQHSPISRLTLYNPLEVEMLKEDKLHTSHLKKKRSLAQRSKQFAITLATNFSLNSALRLSYDICILWSATFLLCGQLKG